jgi:hypothetical protein
LLNRLERDFPEGLLADTAWFGERGYSRQLLNHYVSAGWLEQPARGVYRRPRGTLSWQQAVISLQTLLGQPLALGGQTALDLQGYSHYLAFGQREVHLYGLKALPKWLGELDLDVRFYRHDDKRLFKQKATIRVKPNGTDGLTASVAGEGITTMAWGQWNWPLSLSSVERAYLELLDQVPGRVSFDLADKVMESLANLSPKKLQPLLVDCRSVKAKRLFFFFADRHQHAWVKHLDRKTMDFGKGKRVLAKGGRLEKRYLITVPEELHAAS